MNQAYYSATVAQFLTEAPDHIFGQLSRSHRHDLEQEQKRAWLGQIQVLKEQLASWPHANLYFEFSIPRMGKRADCVLLLGGIVFVIEFKVGSATFDRHAIDQVHDYALDLKNFHKGSHGLPIVPILVATKAITKAGDLSLASDKVASPLCVGSSGIAAALRATLIEVRQGEINAAEWESSGYQPTPTIIEAAQALYQNHDVQEIARSDAGAKNLQSTSARIAEVIETSKREGRKSICFVTGVPGAGKTLAGLNIAAKRAAAHQDEHAVFLSGNGPLVDVLREALARDQAARDGISKKDALRRVRSFLQNIHHFRDEYLRDLNAPDEKVVVFDEAQRAWTKEQASNFMQRKRGQDGFSQSEPEFLISVMDRHCDWCMVVCLIGGGQEINTGEAGILEWLQALATRFPDWDVHASALLEDPHYTVDTEAVAMLRAPAVSKHPDLHLSVSMRSFRAETLSAFVGSIIDGNAERAADLFETVRPRYPIWLTRNLHEAQDWLRTVARGTERFGLVASSGAHRLRPEGIHIKAGIDPATWFLNDQSDVRSSYYLEEVATEFDIQGLELDWVGMCWDANLRFIDGAWRHYGFRGTVWQSVNAAERKLYLENSYRVLLTRARQGMVIFVPEGDPADETRPPSFYDETFAFLQRCGIPVLEKHVTTNLAPAAE
ncbi:DUF2075 domain-containing protein [Flavimaricola marinus]|uniref:Schlafen group 3-like DNA/RNA helicase domain-containing protein n=1 Tax=Flavimaricola marinus TaxID=1819565 RepID=A0A238LC34_9RHOB|nr:DUF2075 domain-containing protein [Flavimaricola marinus]SMY07249.1 hypothetical protein LOM8899_01382 [Flavimaricola marinus]